MDCLRVLGDAQLTGPDRSLDAGLSHRRGAGMVYRQRDDAFLPRSDLRLSSERCHLAAFRARMDFNG